MNPEKKHDIFLSYAQADRGRVASLVEALESNGWSVWWDRDVPVGKTFDEFIEENLDASRIVVVVWSVHSVRSRWVRTEANEGLEAGKLVPVRIDEVRPPLAFRMVQTANLVGWEKKSPSDEFDRCLRDIDALLRESVGRASIIATPSKIIVPSEKTALLSKDGLFTDLRDGQTYKTVQLLGKIWMAQNLNFDVGEDCWFYDNDPSNGEKYGRLYTWEAAKKACPPGWRLPTDEEWRALAMQFGGLWDGEDMGYPKEAYQALIKGGSSGFSALLGGRRALDGKFNTLDISGLYWSNTEKNIKEAWYYSFYSDYGKVGRPSREKSLGCSCRCLQGMPFKGID